MHNFIVRIIEHKCIVLLLKFYTTYIYAYVFNEEIVCLPRGFSKCILPEPSGNLVKLRALW